MANLSNATIFLIRKSNLICSKMFFLEIPDNDRRLILDNGRVLRIHKLDHDIDTGVYQCNASNPFGYVYANAFVNVRGKHFCLTINHVTYILFLIIF